MVGRNTGSQFVRIDDDRLRARVSRIFPVYPKTIDGVPGVMASNGDADTVRNYLANPKTFDVKGYWEAEGVTRDRRLSIACAVDASGTPLGSIMLGADSRNYR